MSHITRRRLAVLAGSITIGAAALVPVAGQAAPPEGPAPDSVRQATAWLSTQLTDGIVHNDQWDYDDLGLTVDIGLALDDVGTDAGTLRQVRRGLATRLDDFVTKGTADTRSSGALAKSLVLAQVSGADPRSYGGYDLVAETEAVAVSGGPEAGRLADVGGPNYANSFGQAFAARGLTNASSSRASDVTGFLLAQQCDAGFFRLAFSRQGAADQTCDDAVDTGSIDTTGVVVSQLARIHKPTPRVSAAIGKAAGWLSDHQNPDGSFGTTPDGSGSNTNSTGLAANALASGGRCVAAGRAAVWMSGLQVGAQSAGSALAADEGAVAYSSTGFASGADGIDETERDQWRRATAQAVPGLLHRLGSTSDATASAAAGVGSPGASTTLTVTGVSPGDRFCLTGPGIDGARRVVAGGNGELTSRVRLPLTTGAVSWSFRGSDGVLTASVDVRTSAPPSATPTLSPVAGVALNGPRGYRAAGSRVLLDVIGATPGARYALRGPGLADVPLRAGPDGVLHRAVTLPADTGAARYRLVGSDGQQRAVVDVLGSARLKVKVKKKWVSPRTRQKVVVRRLAPRERVRVIVRGRVVDTGRANARGRFVAKFSSPAKTGRVRVKATGHFPSARRGAARFRIKGRG